MIEHRIQLAQVVPHLAHIVAAGQIDSDTDRIAEPLGVGAAMALHYNAVQAQQGPPLMALGSIFWRIFFNAGMAMTAPSLDCRLEVNASFNSAEI